MIKEEDINQLKNKGFINISQFYNKEFLSQLASELSSMSLEYYNEMNLRNHSVYFSDKTSNRESYSMMINDKNTSLPSHNIKHRKYSSKFYQDFQALLNKLSVTPYPEHARGMLNWQFYSGESKPVAEHFDGEFLDFSKLSPTRFTLNEGLLPQYVFILTIENENKSEKLPRGTILRNTTSSKEFFAKSVPGDLLIFDNVKYRHRVPKLLKPRKMVGLRTFDYMSLHYLKEKPNNDINYQNIPEGYISENIEPVVILKDFLKNKWPNIFLKQRREGALF